MKKFPGFILGFATCIAVGSVFAFTSEKKSTDTDVTYETASYKSSARNLAKELSHSFTEVAKSAVPSVVYIHAEVGGSPYKSQEDTSGDFFNDDFFRRFFGGPQQQEQQIRASQGSGFIITSDGYIMTNYHVVKDASKLTVDLNDEDHTELEAHLVGGDPQTDIAILKIEANKPLPFLKYADSNHVEVGEWAIAIGNPFQLEASVTVGVISAKGRNNLQISDLEDFIQTDAAINPGNSGGPLLNLDGEVTGMNTAIVSRSGGYMGIGFAIPSNILKTVKKQIIDNGEVSRGFLGVALQPVDKEMAEALNMDKAEGALVAEVMPDSPAEKGGLEQGDVILEINGKTIRSVGVLRNEILLLPPGSVVNFKIIRQGKTQNLKVKIGQNDSAKISMSGKAKQLGLEIETLTPETAAKYNYRDEEGVIIKEVLSASPAHRAGLKRGWVIVAVNHKKVTNAKDFMQALDSSEKGRVLVLVNARGSMRFYSLKLPK